MTRRVFGRPFLPAAAAVLAGALAVAGCHNGSHADEKDAVRNALNSSKLYSVNPSQDRYKGVITLTGNVDSDDLKSQAEAVAKQAAPDYIIANEIAVRPTGAESQASAVSSNLDSAIEHNFKASIKAHKNLDQQSIHYSVKNGTLVLKGTVKTDDQKREAESLAKQVPNVQQVVNELEVKPKKHSSAMS